MHQASHALCIEDVLVPRSKFLSLVLMVIMTHACMHIRGPFDSVHADHLMPNVIRQ